jgi:hypothetical protein
VVTLFNERQQIFLLPTGARSGRAAATTLSEALAANAPVRALLNPRQGVVERVDTLPSEELHEFEERRTLLEDPEKAMRIDVSKIDPTTFNIVDHYLKVPVFRLCTKAIPSYKVAKDIFDFCAAQSCNLPGPPAFPPCIPFQYVRDGCYARAHEMRKIIAEKRASAQQTRRAALAAGAGVPSPTDRRTSADAAQRRTDRRTRRCAAW